ncbi:hypothetical protein A4H97_10805 [Niastella yeongjuensis]|uniref:Uncharacterized protein n=1 Tax=Niastella yeongjuensis TaxID=354355 RepID=A0A1V9EFK9_9BACT|nr:hypothetical protein [Niastella yeongjuensis]OQP44841.1 hypothetical protein A4H97_10805 [Niastella yeongjuensis]SEP42033.1 hypothetical protein SAMN05660816_05938 [Niastella yeongjuensis]
MIIRCKIAKGRNITPNQLYQVVAVVFNLHSQKVDYNIVNDSDTLAFHDANLFEIEDNKSDADWVLKKVSEEFYTLLPEMLAYDGFYEAFHNDDRIAREKFKIRFPDLYEKLIR